MHVNERNENKAKPIHVTFKLITRSIVQSSLQTMQWFIKERLHCLTPDSVGRFHVNNILMLDSA